MVLKLALIIAAIAILITLGTIAVYQSGRGTPNVQDKDSLVEIARQTKAKGHDKARISGWIIDYGGENMSLDWRSEEVFGIYRRANRKQEFCS